MCKFFLLEDDPIHAEYIRQALGQLNFEIKHFSEPHEFFRTLPKFTPGLIVLDWMLPELSGFQALRRIRDLLGRRVPVVMLTQFDSDERVVEALDAGADDFLVKPISAPVLRARIEALLRRFSSRIDAPKFVNLGPYRLEFSSQRATIGGESVELTPKEFDLAWVLLTNPNRFISKAELMVSVWGRSADIGSHTMAQHMHAVRKKMAFAHQNFRLSAVYGAGYRLESPLDAELELGTRDRSDSALGTSAAPSVSDSKILAT